MAAAREGEVVRAADIARQRQGLLVVDFTFDAIAREFHEARSAVDGGSGREADIAVPGVVAARVLEHATRERQGLVADIEAGGARGVEFQHAAGVHGRAQAARAGAQRVVVLDTQHAAVNDGPACVGVVARERERAGVARARRARPALDDAARAADDARERDIPRAGYLQVFCLRRRGRAALQVQGAFDGQGARLAVNSAGLAQRDRAVPGISAALVAQGAAVQDQGFAGVDLQLARVPVQFQRGARAAQRGLARGGFARLLSRRAQPIGMGDAQGAAADLGVAAVGIGLAQLQRAGAALDQLARPGDNGALGLGDGELISVVVAGARAFAFGVVVVGPSQLEGQGRLRAGFNGARDLVAFKGDQMELVTQGPAHVQLRDRIRRAASGNGVLARIAAGTGEDARAAGPLRTVFVETQICHRERALGIDVPGGEVEGSGRDGAEGDIARAFNGSCESSACLHDRAARIEAGRAIWEREAFTLHVNAAPREQPEVAGVAGAEVDVTVEVNAIVGLEDDVGIADVFQGGFADPGVIASRLIENAVRASVFWRGCAASGIAPDTQVIRVQQQGPGPAFGRAHIHPAPKRQMALARDLHKTASAPGPSAFGRDSAMIARGVIGPDNHPTAFSLFRGIGGEFYVLADISHFGVLNGRIPALIIPARQDPAAAHGARGVQPRLAEQADLVARDLNLPAFSAL